MPATAPVGIKSPHANAATLGQSTMKSVVGAWNRTPHLVLSAKCGIWRIVRRMAS
jgi:hypothetical protein